MEKRSPKAKPWRCQKSKGGGEVHQWCLLFASFGSHYLQLSGRPPTFIQQKDLHLRPSKSSFHALCFSYFYCIFQRTHILMSVSHLVIDYSSHKSKLKICKKYFVNSCSIRLIKTLTLLCKGVDHPVIWRWNSWKIVLGTLFSFQETCDVEKLVSIVQQCWVKRFMG